MFRYAEQNNLERMMSDKQTVQSVERAFLILDLMRENRGGMGIRQIANAAGLNTTSTYRFDIP